MPLAVQCTTSDGADDGPVTSLSDCVGTNCKALQAWAAQSEQPLVIGCSRNSLQRWLAGPTYVRDLLDSNEDLALDEIADAAGYIIRAMHVRTVIDCCLSDVSHRILADIRSMKQAQRAAKLTSFRWLMS